jgi:hypothetical protein
VATPQRQQGRARVRPAATPHHCSWHSLSKDSWSDLGEKVKVDADARKALSQTRGGATIVASCKPIKDDDSDPPCIRAKREYVDIVNDAKGQFFCTGEYPNADAVEPLEFTVSRQGLQAPSKKQAAAKLAAVVSIGTHADAARLTMAEAVDDAIARLGRHRAVARVGTPSTTGGLTEVEVDIQVELPSHSRHEGSPRRESKSRPAFVFRATGRCLRRVVPAGGLSARPAAHQCASPWPGGVAMHFEGSLDELMHRFGVDAVVDQLVDWLHKAASGTLIDLSQGWEPARRDSVRRQSSSAPSRSRPWRRWTARS